MNRFLNIRTLLGLALGLGLLVAGPAVTQAALGDDLPDAVAQKYKGQDPEDGKYSLIGFSYGRFCQLNYYRY